MGESGQIRGSLKRKEIVVEFPMTMSQFKHFIFFSMVIPSQARFEYPS